MWVSKSATIIQDTGAIWCVAPAKKKGCKIVSVDPTFTDRTDTVGQWWIPIRPRTDIAMLIAMAYVIVSGGSHDQAFLDKYMLGVDKFREYVLSKENGVPKTPAWAEANNPQIAAIPKYIDTWEGRNDPLAKRYPLQLMTTHFKLRAHSQFDNIPWLRQLEPQAEMISAADAEARGTKDGDLVRAFNDRGEMIIAAKATERIMPAVVDVPHGAWYDPDEQGVDRGACASVLIRDERSAGRGISHQYIPGSSRESMIESERGTYGWREKLREK